MSAPQIGESYRGVEGHSGYLLRQAWHALNSAMEVALREHGLTGPHFAVLSVLRRDPGMSGADLARACNTTPQAMNGVLATLESSGLVERHPHPTHGRILQVEPTEEGRSRLEAATPAVRRLERAIEEGLDRDEVAAMKEWLVASARRLDDLGGRSGGR